MFFAAKLLRVSKQHPIIIYCETIIEMGIVCNKLLVRQIKGNKVLI